MHYFQLKSPAQKPKIGNLLIYPTLQQYSTIHVCTDNGGATNNFYAIPLECSYLLKQI